MTIRYSTQTIRSVKAIGMFTILISLVLLIITTIRAHHRLRTRSQWQVSLVALVVAWALLWMPGFNIIATAIAIGVIGR